MKPLNIVISGCFTTSALNGYGREQVRNFIVSAGHNLRSSMSKSTSYLVVGTAKVPGRGVGPSKLAQAQAFGIPVVTFDQFRTIANI